MKDRKPPFDIAAGLVTYESSWADPFGTPLTNALAALAKSQCLNFGIAADSGYFEAKYVKGAKPAVNTFKKTRALAAFIMRLLAHLQTLGTVTAMDYKEYRKSSTSRKPANTGLPERLTDSQRTAQFQSGFDFGFLAAAIGRADRDFGFIFNEVPSCRPSALRQPIVASGSRRFMRSGGY